MGRREADGAWGAFRRFGKMPIDDERDARAERKRRDVLDAARRRFMTEGYASTGMEAVARDAGVSTATLYAYFPSKSDLFNVVVDDAADAFLRRIDETAHVQGDSAAQLRAFALAYARFISDPFVRAVFRLVAAERRRFETVARRFYNRLRDEFGGVLIGILRRLQAEGRVRLTKPSWAAGQLMGMIEHPTFLAPLAAGDDAPVERPLEDICDDAVETFLARYGVRGVGAEAA